MNRKADLVVLYEHPEWQKPLFEALRRRGAGFEAFDLKSAVLSDRDVPAAPLYFNQASPSAYLRGHTRAVPFALALLEDLECRGAKVLNGAAAFRLELSKMAQIGLMRRLGIPHPRTWIFNDPKALLRRARELPFPAVLKPNQGGSGARMVRLESLEELQALLDRRPELWLPDNLLLLQEFLPHDDTDQGIVRIEFLGGELLYAIRVVSAGSFNLCPSDVCNPECPAPQEPIGSTPQGPRFYPYFGVPKEALATGRALFRAAGLDVGAVEYLETTDGRRIFYDINANSNLRRSIGEAYGFDPFERVVDFLVQHLERATSRRRIRGARPHPDGHSLTFVVQ
ncbi:MAG: RimK family alpha-L-glutamate ligase [Acidobacteriota bacterium]